MRIFVHRGLDTIFDATPKQIQKVMNLYNRPGTPGEKAAAAAALERMGVRPPVKGGESSEIKQQRAGPKKYKVDVKYHDADNKGYRAQWEIEASDEIDAEAKARELFKKTPAFKGAKKGVSSVIMARARRIY